MKKGWEIKKLVEICDLITCGVAKRPEYVDDGIPFLSAKNIKKGQVIWNDYKYISKKTHSELTKNNKPLKGDILYTRVGSYGEAAVIEEDLEFSVFVSLTLIKPKPDCINKYFLKYYLNSDYVKKLAKNSISGSGVGNLNVGTVRKFEIPLPPLQEQQRIVAILDKTFAAIVKAKTNAEQNLKNTKELFESYLQNVFENKGDDWEEKRLDELTEVKDGTHDSPKYIADGIPFVTQKNIKFDGFNIENTKFITKIDHQKFYKRSNVTYGDILISMIGANRGMSAIVDIKETFSIKNVGLIKESENINQFFLLNYLQSTFAMKYVKLMSNGGAQEFIGLRALRAFPIPFPKSIKEQQKIVEKLNSLSAETQKLATIYQQKIVDLEELKKSVLQKAFNGALNTKKEVFL